MDFSLSCPHPADSDRQMEDGSERFQSPPLPVFAATQTWVAVHRWGWSSEGAGEVQGAVCGPPGGRPCWGKWLGDGVLGAQVVVEEDRLGRRGYSAASRARDVLIARPEVDPSLPLGLDRAHVAG